MIAPWRMVSSLMMAFALQGCSRSTPRPVPSVPPFESQSGNRTPNAGMPVPSPESLSGLWEAHDGDAAAVGIRLELITTVPATAKRLHGTVQSWQILEGRVYRRNGPRIAPEDQIGFSDSVRGGSAKLDRGRLSLHRVSYYPNSPSVDLDLVQSGTHWVGRLHLGSFDHHVVLLRPGIHNETSPLVGTWRSPPSSSRCTCLHIVQTSIGDFSGWFDSLQLFGSMSFAPNIPKSITTTEFYGEPLKVTFVDGDVSVELPAESAGCCTHKFVGKISQDGSTIRGLWPDGPNQSPHDGQWLKVPASACSGF
jgi:hypothetical protein